MIPYRDAAFETIKAFGHQCVRMEDFPAEDYSAEQYCREQVRKCEIFVLILGLLYGSSPEGSEISYTEREFDAASEEPPITRLVCVPDPKASTNVAETIQTLEPGEVGQQVGRQREFSARVRKGRMTQPFKSPTDLKDLIVRSLRAHLVKEEATIQAPSEVGSMWPKICDRQPQLGDFARVFDTPAAGTPQIFVLHGRATDQHASCVERMICRNIRRLEKIVAPDPDSRAVEFPAPEPPDPDDIPISRFLCDLIPVLGRSNPARDPRPEDLCVAGIASGAQYVVLRHLLKVSGWTPERQSFFAGSYLRLWDSVAENYAAQVGKAALPRFLIFLEFKHGEGEGAAFRTLMTGLLAGRTPKPASPAAASIHLLPELRDVDDGALETWVENFRHRMVKPYLMQTAEELFPETPLPMSDVETKLKRYLGWRDV
jgi:hypothetical protein